MKYGASILLIVLCMVYSGCDSSSNPSEPSGETIRDYYPLSVGNEWTYLSTEYDSQGNATSIDTNSVTIDSAGTVNGKSGFYTTNYGVLNFTYYSGNELIQSDPSGQRY